MTRKELKTKYPMRRAEMPEPLERQYVSDLFDLYEEEGFADRFWSQGGNYRVLHGSRFTVLERSTEKELGLDHLPMWKIRFDDGTELDAYPDEVIPSRMREEGCPEAYLEPLPEGYTNEGILFPRKPDVLQEDKKGDYSMKLGALLACMDEDCELTLVISVCQMEFQSRQSAGYFRKEWKAMNEASVRKIRIEKGEPYVYLNNDDSWLHFLETCGSQTVRR